ncbi:glycoprotein 3-alpha-L-fucosyltransferase A-like [Amblyomma americanum]
MIKLSDIRLLLVGACLLTVLVVIILNTDYSRQLKGILWTHKSLTKDTAATEPREPVKILFWTKTFGSWLEPLATTDSGLISYSGCNVPCFVTKDRILLRKVDAVVFHGRDVSGNDLPKYRAEHQRWVYWNLEAPPNSESYRMIRLRDVFNWTYTYRRDSDVPHPYFFVRQADKRMRKTAAPVVEWTNRSKLVVWAASNCRASSGRQYFVMELQKHIPEDRYGRCGHLECPRGPKCLSRFAETYYFYLALENSICRDYVTEKFSDALSYGMVPVVLGNYSAVAPPNSYINALDFGSPKQLAEFLKAVASRPSMYNKYFAWRNRYIVEQNNFNNHCVLCEALYKARTGDRRVYRDIVQWWHGNGDVCTTWRNQRGEERL